MMTNNPYQQAASAYQGAHETHMGGFDVVVELYKGIIKNVTAAKTAYQKGELEEMCKLNEKTTKILIALQSHLNHEQGGEAANFLDVFYTGIFGKLMSVLRKEDPAAAFDEILELIKPVYEIWCGHAATNARQSQKPAEPVDIQN